MSDEEKKELGDAAEVLALLQIIDYLTDHPIEKLGYIRAATWARLEEINVELGPEPVEAEEPAELEEEESVPIPPPAPEKPKEKVKEDA